MYLKCPKLGQTCEMASIYLNSMVCGANGYKKNRNVSGILFVRNLIGKCSAQKQVVAKSFSDLADEHSE